jgi:hypothetical protein
MVQTVIAAVALLVALVTLYATALKNADIEVGYVPRSGEVEGLSWSVSFEGALAGQRLALAFYVLNEGARAGALERLKIVEVDPIGSEIVPFSSNLAGDLKLYPGIIDPSFGSPPAMPLPVGIPGGDTLVVYFIASPTYVGTEGTARVLHACAAIDLTVAWTYVQGAGFLRRGAAVLLRHPDWNVRRKEKTRTFRCVNAVREAREVFLERWGSDRHHLAQTEEGQRLVSILRTGREEKE